MIEIDGQLTTTIVPKVPKIKKGQKFDTMLISFRYSVYFIVRLSKPKNKNKKSVANLDEEFGI